MHPEHRRKGIGIALLRSAMPAVQDGKRGVAMYAAMKPDSATSYRETTWTAERIRETERGLAADGAQERVVVAVDADTGHVVGVTGVLRYPHRQEFVRTTPRCSPSTEVSDSAWR
jgi:hypothetical protein